MSIEIFQKKFKVNRNIPFLHIASCVIMQGDHKMYEFLTSLLLIKEHDQKIFVQIQKVFLNYFIIIQRIY